MTGVNGERWPIYRARFVQTYQPVAPLIMGLPGGYLKIRIPVEAKQTRHELDITLKEGTLHAKLSDWFITAPDGKHWVVSNQIFRKTYQQLE